MGEFASTVQEHLLDGLAQTNPEYDWSTEKRIAGTPVDIAGEGTEETLLVELEWRRADPADNAAKLFRHLSAGELSVETVRVFQIFTGYYDLANGGVSSKRKNAEFVGEVAADALDRLQYEPVEFDLEPPKRGEEWPQAWEETADRTVAMLSEQIEVQ